MSALLEVEDLDIAFGPLAAVRGAALSVNRGETHCLVGESGCGKSVMALAVMGLLPSNARRRARTLRFDGKDLLDLNEKGMSRLRGDRMAMIFQEPMTSLNPAYTVGSQMAEVLMRHRGSSKRAALDRAAGRLRALSPRSTLERGYAIVRTGDEIVRAAGRLTPGTRVDVELAEGSFGAEVTDTT